MALRPRVLAPRRGLRPGRRLEPAPAGDDRRRRAAHLRLAADARAAPGRSGHRRARLRPRSLPAGPEWRAPARVDRDPHAAGPARLRARPGGREHPCRARLGSVERGCDRLHPPLRAAAPRARGNSAHRRLHRRAGGSARRRLGRGWAGRRGRRRPRDPPDDRARLGRGGRPLALRGRRVLGGLGRPRQPLAARRAGAVRLRRLARSRARRGRHRPAVGALAGARGPPRHGCVRPLTARAGDESPALRVALGRLPAAALPAGAGQAPADRQPGRGGARRRRRGAHRGRIGPARRLRRWPRSSSSSRPISSSSRSTPPSPTRGTGPTQRCATRRRDAFSSFR